MSCNTFFTAKSAAEYHSLKLIYGIHKSVLYRLRNKGVYVKMGLRKMVGRKMCKDLHKAVRLEVDGRPVDLPAVEGIIILNILR